MSTCKFTIEPSRWYALTMYPGYADQAYFSPIEVHRVTPLGNGLMEIDHLNAGYAQGVQQMTKKYRVHRRGKRHIVLDELQAPERTVIIEPLTAQWIIAHAPWFVERLREVQP